MASGTLDFDGLVKELNVFLAEEKRLHKLGWRGYALRVWANVLSRRLLHPTYSRPELRDQQKDAVAMASDVARVKAEVKAREKELLIEFGVDQYTNMLKLCDDMYSMWKEKFELG